jgi:hypothetical protein
MKACREAKQRKHHEPHKKMDYIPTTDSGFAAWLLNFSILLIANPGTYGTTVPVAASVQAQNNNFQAALSLATDPGTRTPATVAAKDAARVSALAVVRPVAVGIAGNPAVTNENKVAVGVTVRNTIPSPIPAPTVAPVIQFMGAQPLVHTLMVRQPGSTSKAKPAGCIAIEMARVVGTNAATDPAQLNIVGQFGKVPLRQEFDAADRGKIVTYAARYRTRSGPGGVSQAGPWSALVDFIVL